jgi:hypothetical protein
MRNEITTLTEGKGIARSDCPTFVLVDIAVYFRSTSATLPETPLPGHHHRFRVT